MSIAARLTVRPYITSITMSKIKTFVFIDLETTGLPQLENNKTKITELCAVAVQADHIELGVFPRVQNKLALCFNPCRMIAPAATDITGLSNDMLEAQSTFCSSTVELFKSWLDQHRKPICFVAHNGNVFDYPILRAEIDKTGNDLPEDILCVDSLVAFRFLDKQAEEVSRRQEEEEEQLVVAVPFEFQDGFDELLVNCVDEYEKALEKGEEQATTCSKMQELNETTPKKQIMQPVLRSSESTQKNFKKKLHNAPFKSYKLQNVYARLTGKEGMGAHEAEGDVKMMVTCCAVYGEKFVEYASEKAQTLSSVPIMKPGSNVIRK